MEERQGGNLPRRAQCRMTEWTVKGLHWSHRRTRWGAVVIWGGEEVEGVRRVQLCVFFLEVEREKRKEGDTSPPV